MVKVGESVPALIDKAVDFMASGQAFREYLQKTPRHNVVPPDVPKEKAQLYLQRLEYYRQLYRPQQETKK